MSTDDLPAILSGALTAGSGKEAASTSLLDPSDTSRRAQGRLLMSPIATLVARFDDACRALGYSDDLSFAQPHPVLHFDTGLGRETLWHRAAATTDCVNFGVSMKPLPRGALPRAAYPLANLARAAKRAMGVAVKHVHYDANQGYFLGTSLVEGDGVPEWRVWAPGLPNLKIGGYASELEALIAVLEEAARAKVKAGGPA